MGCQFSINSQFQTQVDPINPLLLPGDPITNIRRDRNIDFAAKLLSDSFLINSEKKIKYLTSSNKSYQRYTQAINQAIKNNQGTTESKLLQFLIEEYANTKKKIIFENFGNDTAQSVLKCFIYLYTGDICYKSMQKQLTYNHYGSVCKVIAVVQQNIQLLSKTNSNLSLRPQNGRIQELYRGINKSDNKMIEGNNLYFKTFLSTSKNKKIAQRFGNFVYTIQLNSQRPHSHIVVPKQWNQHNDEEQVLIFPYLYVRCTKKVGTSNTAAQYCVRQN